MDAVSSFQKSTTVDDVAVTKTTVNVYQCWLYVDFYDRTRFTGEMEKDISEAQEQDGRIYFFIYWNLL
jgi:hypothetical protein